MAVAIVRSSSQQLYEESTWGPMDSQRGSLTLWGRIQSSSTFQTMASLNCATTPASKFIVMQTLSANEGADGETMGVYYHNGTDWSFLVSSQALTQGTWYFFHVWWDQPNIGFKYTANPALGFQYVDSGTGLLLDENFATLRIGASHFGEYPDGNIAAVKVWDYPLTDAEALLEGYWMGMQRTNNVRALYALQSPTFLQDLLGLEATLTNSNNATFAADPPLLRGWNPNNPAMPWPVNPQPIPPRHRAHSTRVRR